MTIAHMEKGVPMKTKVYTEDDKVKSIELELGITEYFVIQKALLTFLTNTDMPVDDRILAVVMTNELNEKEQIELNELN